MRGLKCEVDDRFHMPADEGRSGDSVGAVPDRDGDGDTADVTPPGHYVLGVGPRGNDLVDAILRRRATADGRWERLLAGYGMVSANRDDLLQSYYFSEWNPTDRDTVGQYVFGRRGRGGDAEMAASVLRERLDSTPSWDDAWGDDLRLSRITDARAVWLLHSLTDSAGAGATPVLADELASEWDRFDGPPLLGVPTLNFPTRGERPDPMSMRHTDGLVGLARLSSTVDAIVPLDTARLAEPELDVRIDGVPPRFEAADRTIVALLELLCLPGRGSVDRPAGQGSSVKDVFGALKQDHSTDGSRAPILAPAVATGRMEQLLDDAAVEVLVRAAVRHGRLIDFDPETASGVRLVFYGPPDRMETRPPRRRSELLRRAVGESLHADVPDVRVHQMPVDGLDAVHLLGFFRNPRIAPFEWLYDGAVEHVDAETVRGERLRNHWESIRQLMKGT
jgi:hypothetical protein